MKFKFCYDYRYPRANIKTRNTKDENLQAKDLVEDAEYLSEILTSSSFIEFMTKKEIENENLQSDVTNDLIDKCKNIKLNESTTSLTDLVSKFKKFAIDYENSKVKSIEKEKNDHNIEIKQLLNEIEDLIDKGNKYLNKSDFNSSEEIKVDWKSVVSEVSKIKNNQIEKIDKEICLEIIEILQNIISEISIPNSCVLISTLDSSSLEEPKNNKLEKMDVDSPNSECNKLIEENIDGKQMDEEFNEDDQNSDKNFEQRSEQSETLISKSQNKNLSDMIESQKLTKNHEKQPIICSEIKSLSSPNQPIISVSVNSSFTPISLSNLKNIEDSVKSAFSTQSFQEIKEPLYVPLVTPEEPTDIFTSSSASVLVSLSTNLSPTKLTVFTAPTNIALDSSASKINDSSSFKTALFSPETSFNTLQSTQSQFKPSIFISTKPLDSPTIPQSSFSFCVENPPNISTITSYSQSSPFGTSSELFGNIIGENNTNELKTLPANSFLMNSSTSQYASLPTPSSYFTTNLSTSLSPTFQQNQFNQSQQSTTSSHKSPFAALITGAQDNKLNTSPFSIPKGFPSNVGSNTFGQTFTSTTPFTSSTGINFQNRQGFSTNVTTTDTQWGFSSKPSSGSPFSTIISKAQQNNFNPSSS
ncbi:hypothetical protein HZS_1279 [Henneguya salminicola]|nr:hypothetical protein HZS_1279 [Henneguya salminicola]